MHKALIVGCGGSGAKTLAFMMDQLKSMLAERLPDDYPTPASVTLPKGWQFINIDVPLDCETINKLPNVSQAGGSYISCGAHAQYNSIDTTVTATIGNQAQLGTVSSWLVDEPDDVSVAISSGAGQYRRIGRMLFLSKAQEIRKQLGRAVDELTRANDVSLLHKKLHQGDAPNQPIVFVVSSMAGGAGASMALDVCRILADLIPPQRIAMFAVTPDIFSSFDPAARPGTNPNALSVFAEFTAAQFGAAFRDDATLFRALGVPLANHNPMPLQRIFPVGVKAGVEGTLLGDGKPRTVYRALGRGLAALMMDQSALEGLINYNITNTGGTSMKSTEYGWGVNNRDVIPWASFGYAQLSMGRDRYGEYAAQRLASESVQRLLEGHLDETNAEDGDTQINELIEKRSGIVQDKLSRLLPPSGRVPAWLDWRFNVEVNRWTQGMAGKLRERIPAPNGRPGNQWIHDIDGAVAQLNGEVGNDIGGLLYQGLWNWAQTDDLQEKFLDILRAEIARYGVPYAAALLEKLRNDFRENTLNALRAVAATSPGFRVSDELRGQLQGNKNRIQDGQGFEERIIESCVPQLRHSAIINVARRMVPIAEDFDRSFLVPLAQILGAGHRNLEAAMKITKDDNLGAAQVKTDVPNLWPDESMDRVPERFYQAANEVFLTDVGSFPQQFQGDVLACVRDAVDYSAALQEAARTIVAGDWDSAAGSDKAPNDLLVLVEPWVPSELVRTPGSGDDNRDPQPARLELHASPRQVLSRARSYVLRRDYSFERFISVSLRDYIYNAQTDAERNERILRLADCFKRTMTASLPLAQVNNELVQRLYGESVSYHFNFSKIPLAGDAALEKALNDVAGGYDHYKPENKAEPLRENLSTQGIERSIDIFGSYPNYAPIVFDSVMEPIRAQWDSTHGQDPAFWKWRRARPMTGAMPMSDAERYALIGGWYIGRLTGRIGFPNTLDTDDDNPVQVYDGTNQEWIAFEAPMLTPPSRFRHKIDWLPALLESSTLAWMRAGSYPLMESVRPYTVMRGLYDDGITPTRGARVLSGVRLLNRWIFDGLYPDETTNTLPGVASSVRPEDRIQGTGPDVTPEERVAAAKAWLGRNFEFARKIMPGDLAARGQRINYGAKNLGDISKRGDAVRFPFLRDIAYDITEVTKQISLMLDEAYKMGPPEPESPESDLFGSSFRAAPQENDFDNPTADFLDGADDL
ncbi:tubulin-like doman-containing protein [Corynebacterium sp. CCM 9186]|uniref:tubulin-like doman-containing protein n=1 Tax=Corynebacterium meridianum TaxID=2765363 RepID=UPI0020069D94|nr:tubulin-like doman-containing protein [Corynebacterium meridianum]MCK7677422.1 tubulin-like doman-containing protein [Corynebacterium meridianum]